MAMLLLPLLASGAVKVHVSPTQITDFVPFRNSQYSVLIPKSWSIHQYPEGDLLISPKEDASQSSPAIQLMRKKLTQQTNMAVLINDLQKVLADRTGSQPENIAEHALADSGLLRIVDLVYSDAAFRLALIALPDKKGFVNSGFFLAPKTSFEPMGGADLLSIVAGTLRLASEPLALELQADIDTKPANTIAVGISDDTMLHVVEMLEYIIGRRLSSWEKAIVRHSTVNDYRSMPVEERQQAVQKLQNLINAFMQQRKAATDADASLHVRWLLQKVLLDSARQNPVAPGVPYVIMLFSEHRLSVSQSGGTAPLLEPSPLDIYNVPAASVSIQINVQKWRQSKLIQKFWKHFSQQLPKEADNILGEIRGNLLLPPEQAVDFAIKSAADTGSQAVAVVGHVSEKNLLGYLQKAPQHHSSWQAQGDNYYVRKGMNGENGMALRILPWGYIAGTGFNMAAMTKESYSTTEKSPLLRLRVPNFKYEEPVGRRGLEHGEPLHISMDMQIELDEFIDLTTHLYFADAPTARGFYIANAITEAAAPAKENNADSFFQPVWSVEGNRLTAYISIPQAQSEQLFARWSEVAVKRVQEMRMRQIHEDFSKRYYWQTYLGSFNMMFITEMQMGMMAKGMHTLGGTTYSGIFMGVP